MYLTAVPDLYSRRIVGWTMAGTQDETLVEQALAMAVTHRKPPTELMHSDLGVSTLLAEACIDASSIAPAPFRDAAGA